MEIKDIAFLCHSYHRGGVTRWMADAAIALAAKGYNVFFVTLEPETVFFSGIGRETMVQLLQSVPNKVKLISSKVDKLFEFEQPDAIAYRYKKLLIDHVPVGTPVIVSDDDTVWRSATELYNAYPVVGVLHADDEAYYTKANKYNSRADLLISVSNRVTKTVKDRFPAIDIAKIHTIPCGIFLPPVNTATPMAAQTVKLLYAGRVENQQKRVRDLAPLCQALKERNVLFHLTIVGDGKEDRRELEQKITELGFASQVTFAGWQSKPKVEGYMAQSDILVLVSEYEGMPVAMMEALAMGCGFAGTRVSGVEDYEIHPLAGQCFTVFGIGNMQEAAEKIEKLATVPYNVRRQAARELAESQFSMDICLQRYLGAFKAMPVRHYSPVPVSLPGGVALKSRAVAAARYAKMLLSAKKG